MRICSLGINPDDMVNGGLSRRDFINEPATQEEMQNFYVVKRLEHAQIIAPNDARVQLTDSMKKECEGKLIYYNDDHYVVPGEEFSQSITDLTENTQMSANPRRYPRSPYNPRFPPYKAPCFDIKVRVDMFKFS